jgi:hypothetical protein
MSTAKTLQPPSRSAATSTKMYHYAPWAFLRQIVESGELWPSNAYGAGLKPLLWFSTHSHWEPTATKLLVLSSGERRLLTFDDQRTWFGCIRFGIAANDPQLVPWARASAAAGIPRIEHQLIERIGRSLGGNPNQWFAVDRPLPLAALSFEVLRDRWCAAEPRAMAGVWEQYSAITRVTCISRRFLDRGSGA